jgi:hypothetical protein
MSKRQRSSGRAGSKSAERYKSYLRSARELQESIERNRSDSEFAKKRANEIVYIFDANVFVFYAYLEDKKRLTRDFGNLIGQAGPTVLNSVMERLTADFLFSGQLPGQKQENFISVPHFEEVLFQSERIAKLLRDGSGRRSSGVEVNRGKIANILSSEDSAEVKLDKLGAIVPRAWLSALNASAHFSRVLRTAFLSDDDRESQGDRKKNSLVPLDKRGWGQEASLFSAQEVEDWLDVLPDPSATRLPEALRDDAQTLQMLVNLNRHSAGSTEDGHRRYVLVTADKAIERAVKKRLPKLAKQGIEDFIRSPRDYLPLLNLNAMTNALDSSDVDGSMERAFKRVFETLESALNWLVVSKDNQRREFNNVGTPLGELEAAWKAASQYVTVLNARHLAAGAESLFAQIADFIEDDAGPTAARMVENSVSEVRERHMTLVLDMALLDMSLARAGSAQPRRVGIQLLGYLFSGLLPNDQSISTFLDQVIKNGELPQQTLEGLRKSPARFESQLLASCLFVAAERWASAAQFGNRAVEYSIRQNNLIGTIESSYLLALSLRVSMRTSAQFRRARQLLNNNIRRYARSRDNRLATLLRRLRDEMELGNLLLSAASMQELAATDVGRKVCRGGRVALLGEQAPYTQFRAGAQHLIQAREELLDSEPFDLSRSTLEGRQSIELVDWMKLLSAINLVGSFIFERIVPGLQYVRPAIVSCDEALQDVERNMKARAKGGEQIYPTQQIYYWTAKAILTQSSAERLPCLENAASFLEPMVQTQDRRPLCDRLEFAYIAEWIGRELALSRKAEHQLAD